MSLDFWQPSQQTRGYSNVVRCAQLVFSVGAVYTLSHELATFFEGSDSVSHAPRTGGGGTAAARDKNMTISTKKLSNSIMLMVWSQTRTTIYLAAILHFGQKWMCWQWKRDKSWVCNTSCSVMSQNVSVYLKKRNELGFYFWWAMIGHIYQLHMHTMLLRQISYAKVKSWTFYPSVLKCTILKSRNSAHPQISNIR